jgi:hypothetical protein
MKSASYFPVAAVFVSLTAAELSFTEVPSNNLRRGLRGNSGSNGEGLTGYWGQFHHLNFVCKRLPTWRIQPPIRSNSCPVIEPKQMWRFQDEGEHWNRTGLVYNMDGGCLGVRGDVAEGKNLKVLECDQNNAKQQWWTDGDSLELLEQRANYDDWNNFLCVEAETHPIKPKDPAVFSDCSDSLDY